MIRVTATATVGTDLVVRFEVSDTGNGIAADKLATIFQPFVQADTSTSRKYGGTGLGLAISSQLVALMGGDCGVSSELGEGSTFWFTICVHSGTGRTRLGELTPDSELAGVTALIVDDNATQLGVLSQCLSDWGMTVAIADSGATALAMMRTAASDGRAFAVALIDLVMPGMDGLELMDYILADPDLTAGVVLMTGLGQEPDFDEAAALGRCVSLSKPVHRDDLRDCLRRGVGFGDRRPRSHRTPATELSTLR